VTRWPRAVLLDLDGTILDHDGASSAAILTAMEASGISHNGDAEAPVSRWRELEAEHFQRYLDGELDFEEQRIVRARDFLQSFGRTESDPLELLRWFDGYREAYERSWRAFDDVQPFLDGIAALDDALTLAVVTNGDHDQQASKLAVLGLERLPLYASSTIGVRKPDPAIFIRVCATLEVDPADAWFVGDNREVDAVSADRAGLHGIWLDRGGAVDRQARPARAAAMLDVLAWIEAARHGS
jgi:putative hydrolase of the HAD superfamily